jgi:hypothetical protein
MKTVFRWLLLMTIVLPFVSTSAYAGWKDVLADNNRKTAEYINQLKDGADPAGLERPFLRHINVYEAKQQKRRFIEAMDEAERLARAGKHDQIKALAIDGSDAADQSGSERQRREAKY